MPSWPPTEFPNLTSQNYEETSPATTLYNCIAWGVGNDARWWWPDPANAYYWPQGVPREESIAAFELAFATMGYARCTNGTLEADVEKVAIYGILVGGEIYPTHAARQLPDGRWTSKLGTCEDIEHDTPEVLNGPAYGSTVCFLARRRTSDF